MKTLQFFSFLVLLLINSSFSYAASMECSKFLEMKRSFLEQDLHSLRQKIGPKIIVLLGPPGAGKGTQAKFIAQTLNIPHLSTGDLFRAEVKTGSALGKQMDEYMKKGVLIPKELANQVLENRISADDCKNGFILDGYPRSLDNARDLEVMLRKLGKQVDVVLHFDVEKKDLIDRLTGRLTCTGCGQSYHITFAPPTVEGQCNNCKSPVQKRADDTPEVIEKRLSVYDEQTRPLIDLFFKQDKLYTISGVDGADQIGQKVIEAIALSGLGANKSLSAYDEFEFKFRTGDFKGLKELAHHFQTAALNETLNQKTGIMRRFVYAVTSNPKKIEEYIKIFSLYGIEVVQTPDLGSKAVEEHLLRDRTSHVVPLAIIRERSNLYRPGSDVLSSMRNGVDAENKASLEALFLEGDQLVHRTYRASTSGVIDLSRSRPANSVFGWDDVFVVRSVGQTYQELQDKGLKVSSREKVLSDFIFDQVHYKKLKDLRFSASLFSRPVDFSQSLDLLLKSNAYFSNETATDYGFLKMLTTVLNKGVFLKSVSNRRQGNYWFPSGNGGLPLTAKKDDIHELTFMVHDVGHFLMKDLIYIGNDTLENKRAYIAYRMISEACTLVLADMVFVDSLVRSGIPYDYSARHIYPLFQDFGIDLSDGNHFLKNLKKLLRASVRYTVLGDDSSFKKLLQENGKGTENLNAFKKKYMPFFVEDFRWTEHNYEHMAKRSSEVRKWWAQTRALREKNANVHFQTIDGFVEKIGGVHSDFVERIFETIFEENIKPVFSPKKDVLPLNRASQLKNAFVRYITTQMALLSKFSALEETSYYERRINELLEKDGNRISLERIDQIRFLYDEYLSILSSKNLISKDDERTFKEVYPLYDPFYVSYDNSVDAYEDLDTVSARILGESQYQVSLLNKVKSYLGREVDLKEKKFHRIMSSLIQHAGGVVEDGLFVLKPGLRLIAKTEHTQKLPPDLMSATFLLAGVGVETSMELIAHSEASVARLTTSKTNAMNLSLYRVSEKDLLEQKRYIEGFLKYRTRFESEVNPRSRWDAGSEAYNILNSGNKATALSYTMTLADYHKLFIGRMGASGNETEVREVVKGMCEILHAEYPEYILAPEEYEKVGNGQKYKIRVENEFDFKAKSFSVIAQTKLTPDASPLLAIFNIDENQSDADRLSEFQARITYLSVAENQSESKAYNKKMISRLEHLSVTSANRIGFMIPKLKKKQNHELLSLIRVVGGVGYETGSNLVISATPKGYKKIKSIFKAKGLSEFWNWLYVHYPLVFER